MQCQPAQSTVAELTDRARAANDRLMRGDIAGYRRAIEVTSDFTLMDPFGGAPSGAPADDAHWARIAALFRDGRDTGFDLLASYASPDMVVLVANERAHVAFGPLPAQPWSLRVTLVFRREDGEWRLAHRHADPLATAPGGETIARLGRGATAADARTADAGSVARAPGLDQPARVIA